MAGFSKRVGSARGGERSPNALANGERRFCQYRSGGSRTDEKILRPHTVTIGTQADVPGLDSDDVETARLREDGFNTLR